MRKKHSAVAHLHPIPKTVQREKLPPWRKLLVADRARRRIKQKCFWILDFELFFELCFVSGNTRRNEIENETKTAKLKRLDYQQLE